MTKVSSRRFYENRQNLALGTALALSLAYLPTPAQAQSDFYNCDAGETTLDIAAFRDPTKFTTRPIIVCNGTETTNTRVLNIVDAAGTPPLAPRIMFIGEQPDAIGTIVIGKAGEAAGVTVAVQDELIAGVSGKGTLRVLGGADVTAGNFYVGVNGTAVGVAEISGQGTTLSARDSIRVGLGGQSQGALTISDGATVTSNNGMAVGVGETGTGTLSITTGGKLNVVGSFITGLVNTSVGVTTVTGAGSAVTAGQDLTVAEHDSSKGTLRVLDGGSASASNVFIGRNATSTGDATVSGTGSTLAASTFLGIAIGSTSTGTLTVANGGTVGVAATGTNLITIGEFGGNGRLVVGSLTDAANTGAGRVAVRTIGLGSGGSLIFSHNQDSTGSDAYEFGTALASFGSPTAGKLLVSAGTTRLTGNSVSFGGTTDIAGGNLIVANNLGGSITVGADGTLTLADGGRVNDLKNNGLVVLATDGVTSFQAGMQGAGDLQKVGTGTATLTGQNTLTGNVFVAAGTLLTTGANLASASAYFVGVDASGNKTGGGTLAVGDGFDITKETLVSGENAVLTAPRIAVASKLQVLGSGTVRAAGPGTPISIRSGGEIVLGLREAPGTSSAGRIDGVLDIESGGTLSFAHNGTAATPFAFTTEVTGAGAIRSEAGYTSLRGTMTGFTGAIRVVGGNLALATTLGSAVQIDKGGIFTLTDAGTFTGQLSNAGTLAIDSARNLSYDTGAVSGTGGIQKDGAGTLTLTGTNQASGGVTVNAGRLNGAAAAIGAGPITVNGGTLAATDALTITNAATVSGTGSVLDASALTVGNGGTLTLANSGLAAVGGGTATLNVASGGTLILGGATAAAAPGSVSAAGIALAAGGGLTLNTLGTAANPYAFATTLSGAGTLTSRAGYNRLTANLSGFSGETVVSGGTLSLATTLTGPVRIVQGGTFALTDAGTFSGSLANAGTFSIDTAGNKELDVGAFTGIGAVQKDGTGTLTLTGQMAATGGLNVNGGTVRTGVASVGSGPLAINTGATLALTVADAATLASTLTGAGTLQKAGAGTLTYSGNGGGFKGVTQIDAGGLRLTGSLGGAVTIAQAGTLTLTDQGNLSGAVTNNGTLDIDTAQTKTLTASFGGAGALRKSGTGTLTLTGANTLGGGLQVAGGTLAVTDTSIGTGPLSVGQGATLAYASATNQTLAAALSGAGTFAKGGTGTLTLTGANTLGGGLQVAGGTLAVTDTSIGSGPLSVGQGATLAYASATNQTLATALSGAGTFAKGGTGTLTLTGANTLGGGLQVAGGTLAVNDTSVGTGPLAVAQGATLAYASAANQTLAAALSGAGTFAKGGTGTLTLTGANTLGGGLQVAGGTLAVTDTSVGTGPLDVAQGATLAYASAADQTLAAALSGAGTFAKGGTGVLAVDRDDSAFTGTFRLDAGALRVNGTLGGGVSIANGATLRGTGTVGSLTVAEGGTVAPGNAIGTLRVTGNATFAAGSNYLVEIDSTPGADQLLVGGSATLNGAKVTVAKLSTAYRPGTRFTIVTANGGINGQFTGPVQEAAPFLDLALAYDGTHVYLDIARALDFAAVAQTGNQRAISPVIEALGTGNAIYDAVLVSDDATIARNAFDSLSGEVHASARIAAIEDGRLVRNAVVSRMSDAEGRGVWAQGFYNDGESRASDGSATLSRSTTGGVMGLDIGGDNGSWRFGVAGGYTDNNLNIGQRFSQGHVRTTHATAYAGAGIGPVKAMVGFSYGWVRNTLDRTVAIGDFGDSLRSRYNGQLIQGFGDLSAPIALSTGTIAPFANVAYVQSRSDRFAETGGAAALAGRSGTENVTITRFGMRVATKALGIFSVKADAGWQHSFGDVDPATALNFRTGGSSFAITGSSLSRDAAVVNAEGVFDVSSRLRLSGGYAGSIGTAGYDSAVTARASFAF
jgi:outer membrane autotransporter protein